jgi:type I restriction enzyme, S subunit
MTSEVRPRWETVKLGELCSFRAGSAFKPDRQGKSEGTFPFIKVRDLSHAENGRFIRGADNWVDDADVTALKARPFNPGTVVFAKIGEALKANRFRVLVRDTLIDNNMMGATPDPTRVEPRFFHYLLHELKLPDLAAGSAMPYLKQADLAEVRVDLPRRDEQLRIAGVLSSLDDKIDSSRQIAKTLEEAATAVFKARFVDFLDRDDLVESDVGPIPRGWNLSRLDRVAALLTRGRSPVYLDEGGVLVLNQKCVRFRRVNFDFARRHDEQTRSSEDRRLRPGDVLVNSTGVGTLGRVSEVRWLPEPATVDSHVTMVRADSAHMDQDYLALCLMGRQADLEHMGHGSTGQTELTRSRLAEMPILVPPREEQDSLSRFYSPIREQIGALERQAIILSEIRDTLLPRLLSGSLRVGLAGD